MKIHVRWKLMFSFREMVRPDQVVFCNVMSAYPFQGSFLTMDNPECFEVHALMVGHNDQITPDTAALVVCRKPMRLEAARRHEEHLLSVRNTSHQAQILTAELHGHVFVETKEELIEQAWEGPSYLVEERG